MYRFVVVSVGEDLVTGGLDEASQRHVTGCEAVDLMVMEAAVAPLVRNLADEKTDAVLPWRG